MDEVANSKIPQWITNLASMVRPGGVALMFLIITIFPIMFALVEIAFHGTGIRIAMTISGYFQAVPEIFYTTLQVMFIAYVAGKSAERVAENVGKRGPSTTNVQVEKADVSVNPQGT